MLRTPTRNNPKCVHWMVRETRHSLFEICPVINKNVSKKKKNQARSRASSARLSHGTQGSLYKGLVTNYRRGGGGYKTGGGQVKFYPYKKGWGRKKV